MTCISDDHTCWMDKFESKKFSTPDQEIAIKLKQLFRVAMILTLIYDTEIWGDKEII